MAFSTEHLPDRLIGVPFEEWVPSREERQTASPDHVNVHAHHDTNPWGWDGARVAAELWSRGVSRIGIAAFDSGAFIDSIATLARFAGEPIPCFIEALTLTPGEGEVWNDLPGRAYVEAGPFATSAEAAPLSDVLTALARRRAEYQAARWNERLDLGFEYRPDWDGLAGRGITEANLARDIVDAVKSRSPDPDAVWRQVPGLDARPDDPNFARAFRNATMVAEDAVARVPRTPEFYLSTETFVRLSGGRARYMYIGKSAGEEADRYRLLERIEALGFSGLCAIPQRNLDTPEHSEDFGRFVGLLARRDVPTILGTELNAHGQWWDVDLAPAPFCEARPLIEATWEACAKESLAI